MDIRSAAEWDPHIGVLRRRYAEHEGDPAAQTKPIHHLGTVETWKMVAAPDEEKNPFLLRVNSGPDRDTMSPIKSPARVGTISTPGIIFLGKVGPPDAHATRRRSPCSGSHPPTRTGPVAVDRKMYFAPVGPARQSDRQVADAPCNRRFVSHPVHRSRAPIRGLS